MKKTIRLFLMFIFLCSSIVSAQKKTVKGIVTDESNLPIPGVSVLVKDSNQGVSTDFDGNYTIEVEEGRSLIFSYLGYATKTVIVDNSNVLNVKLTADVSELDEIVVVGYGTQRVRDIAGAVSVLDGKVVTERKTTQLSTALQGSIPGVTVSRSSGNPGATGNILIRGVTSLGNSSPLVLIDGVPGGIDDVNPDDVASLSVLKDASSAAIYGSRAAAGVILITTKRAKTGKAVFSYNVDSGVQVLGNLPEFTDAVTYMTLNNEMRVNDGQSTFYTQDHIDNYIANNKLDPDGFPLTDWNKTFFKNSAFQTRHNFSMSIGGDKLKSNASIGWVEQGALTPNRNYKRMNLRLNNNYQFSESISAIFDVNFKRTIRRSPSQGTDIFSVFRLAPIWDDFYEDGRYAPARTGNNPLANALEGGDVNEQFNSLGARIGLVIKPIEGLTVKAIAAPKIDFDRSTDFRKLVNYGEVDDPDQIVFTSGGTANTLRERSNKSETLNIQATVDYKTEFNDAHKLEALIGFEDNRYQTENLLVGRDGYIFLDYPLINSGSEEIQTTGGNAAQTALRSYFGRASYNYKDKYHIQVNARYDGSSRFSEDYRWGFFPSFAAAWTISEESFAKEILGDNYLKIRASWGRIGNQRIGNYPYISEVTLADNLFYNGTDIVPLTTGDVRTLSINDISWETTEKTNLGIDLKLVDNKLDLTIEGFKHNTFDLLRTIPILDIIGLNPSSQNVAEIETYGWETGITWKDRVGEFKYRIGLNVTDSKTTVKDLKGTSSLGNTSLIEGEEYNIYYGYRSLGFLTQEDIDNNVALINSNNKPGDMRYEDISGPNGVPDGVISAEYDRTTLESSRPRYTYGGNIGFEYKNFDFNTSFQGVAKRTRYYSSFMVRPFINSTGNIPQVLVGNTWTPENTDAEYPRLTDRNDGNNYLLSDYWLRTAAYFRISNMTLGYTIPGDVIKSMGISSLRIYATGNDVFLSSNYPKGFDPEIGITSTPITSTYLLGLNVKF